jgi:flagellar basal body-associated protein FliL
VSTEPQRPSAPTPRRRRRLVTWLVVLVVVAVVAVAAVAIGTRVYTSNENAKASATPTVAATRAPSTVDTADLAGAWTIGSGSQAG